MKPGEPFVMADFGAADGANESVLFEAMVKQIHSIKSQVQGETGPPCTSKSN
jgi:hypothetical protein